MKTTLLLHLHNGIDNTLYTASWALTSRFARNTEPSLLSCCLVLPCSISHAACFKSSPIPFSAFNMYDAIYMTQAYALTTYWISIFASHALRMAGE